MTKGRLVGTFTTGLVLVMVGGMFLLKLIYPSIDYLKIASLWPVILVLLGVEIIVAYLINKDEIMKYDFAAIILIIIVSVFSMGMGCMEYVIAHIDLLRDIL